MESTIINEPSSSTISNEEAQPTFTPRATNAQFTVGQDKPAVRSITSSSEDVPESNGIKFQTESGMRRTQFNATSQDIVYFSDGSNRLVEHAIAEGLLRQTNEGLTEPKMQAQDTLTEPEQILAESQTSITVDELSPESEGAFSSEMINTQMDAVSKALGDNYNDFISKAIDSDLDDATDYLVRQLDVERGYAETTVKFLQDVALQDARAYVEGRGKSWDKFKSHMMDSSERQVNYNRANGGTRNDVINDITNYFKTRNVGILNKYIKEVR